jgi:hypothetical protein
MTQIESRDDGISVTLKGAEASALAAVAEIGLDADEALGRILVTATAESALRELRASRGSLELQRAAASTLIAIAERGLRLAGSPRSLFRPLFDGIDLAAAQRGLDQVTSAMR